MPGAIGEQLNSICRRHCVELMYLFGSQVEAGLRLLSGKGVMVDDPLTDLDVGVVIEGGLPAPEERLRLYSQLQTDLGDVFRPFMVDLVLLQENHSVFQLEAIKGECVYGPNLLVRDAYELQVLRRAADFRPVLRRFQQEILEEV